MLRTILPKVNMTWTRTSIYDTDNFVNSDVTKNKAIGDVDGFAQADHGHNKESDKMCTKKIRIWARVW